MPESVDVVIRGASVYDGTGAPPRRADVALAGDRVASVGDASALHANLSLDASGLALAPGFVDVHTHDDFALVTRPEMDFKILGGVTTVVVGNCGLGASPWSVARGWAGAFAPEGTVLPEWDGFAGYFALLDREPASTNAAALVGHAVVRASAMGNERRAPDARELEAMRALVREGRDAGAVGFSTGLIYEPGRWADPAEVTALAAVFAGTGGLYATHMRDEGLGLLDSVRESIEVGRRAGVPVQISHHKASGSAAWGLVKESLRLIEAAQAEGLDVTADQYPYTAGSTGLFAIVRNGAFDGGPGGLGRISPDKVVIAASPGHPEWEGKTIVELGSLLGLEPQAAALRAVELCPATTAVLHSMSEDDVRTVMRHKSTMIGSDGIPSLPGKPHPRLWGTFARVLGRYARDLGLFPLAEAVHRMTGMAARKFGLRDRGVIRAGAFADLVVFDPARILDVGTYEDPNHPPVGVRDVFVNGARVVRDGAHTGARPGRALRRA